MKEFYHRHLPHWFPEAHPVFVTWNLKGALPKAALDRLMQARNALARMIGNNNNDREHAMLRNAASLFRISEGFLDQAQTGPHWLQDPRCAGAVMNAILEGAGKWYDLFAFVVMSNHVHLLITPSVDLDRITGGIKKKTGREINVILGRSEKPCWQDESFDHWPRSGVKFMTALIYIENNPVKAGLCVSPECWPWSSATLRQHWKKGERWRRSAL